MGKGRGGHRQQEDSRASHTQDPTPAYFLPSARPSTMTLWKYSLLAVSFISLSCFLWDTTNKHLEYSVSLVSSRN